MMAEPERRESHLSIINRILKESARTSGFGWGRVRSFGELQILTRASYVALLAIPIIAGIWPGLRTAVNRYSETIQGAADRLELASAKFHVSASEVAPLGPSAQDVNEIVDKLRESAKALSDQLRERAIEGSRMPDVWVLAFLASLCAIIAQTIYQVAAPLIVRRFSRREYINGVIDDAVKLNPNMQDVKSTEFDRLVMNSADIYDQESRSYMSAAWVSMVLYVTAVAILLLIIYTQTVSVLRAAEWI